MIGLFCFVLAVLASPFKSKLRLEAENVVLRHQLNVLRRRLHSRVRLTNSYRWFFIQLCCWFPSILQVLTIIRHGSLVQCADLSLGKARRCHSFTRHPGRTSSPLRASLSFRTLQPSIFPDLSARRPGCDPRQTRA